MAISNDAERGRRVRAVVAREIDDEISSREELLAALDSRLLSARKTFHRLRYAIVNRKYGESVDADEQRRIHPAVKKILNEREDAEPHRLPEARPPRKKIKSEPSNSTTPADPDVAATLRTTTEPIAPCASTSKPPLPMYVEPKGLDRAVMEINTSSRFKQKKKFRIIIGNTSKYIEPSSRTDHVTHRWLLYVRGPPSQPDISPIIESITIQLHESYTPHDIVKLKSSPFHLSKRGWGEFPVKLRIHFKNPIFNKPINLVHNLKLDRYHSGLQTLGGETVADIWLYSDECEHALIASDSTNEIKIEPPSSPAKNVDQFQDLKIKSEPLDFDCEAVEPDNFVFSTDKIKEEQIIQELYDVCDPIYDGDHTYAKTSTKADSSVISHKQFKKNVFESIREVVDLDVLPNLYDALQINCEFSFDIEYLLTLNKFALEKLSNSTVINDIDQINLLKSVASIGDVIIHWYARDLCEMLHRHDCDKTLDIVYKNLNVLKNAVSTNETICDMKLNRLIDQDVLLTGKKVIDLFNGLWSSIPKIPNDRCLVNLMMKRMPLICDAADVYEYSQLFPYSVKNESRFSSFHKMKRRNLMWTRAKMIKNFLQNYFKLYKLNTVTWTTKQIVIFGLYHGYHPLSCNDKTAVATSESAYKFDNVHQIDTKVSCDVFKWTQDMSSSSKPKHWNVVSEPSDVHCISDSSDEEIDICLESKASTGPTSCDRGGSDPAKNRQEVLAFATGDERLQCEYVESVCSNIGIELNNQNIGFGYSYGLVQKLILSAVKNFAEDLLRRSLCVKRDMANCGAVQNGNDENCDKDTSVINGLCNRINTWNISEDSTETDISVRHIFDAIQTRNEFDFLTNFGLGSENVKYKENV